MRRFRAFLFLAETLLKQKAFWVFLVAIVLIGPVFVVLHSETNVAEREMRPLLSERVSVDHFKIGRTTSLGFANKESILLFRTPNTESAPSFPISPVFVSRWRWMPTSLRTDPSSWSFPIIGSLSNAYRNFLPLLMIVAGIMAFPSRRKLAVLRTLLPCDRWSCFLMITGVLALQVVLLGVLAGASTGLALALTPGSASGTTWFIGQYYGTIIVYALGFGLLGIVLAEFVRNRPIALLIGLVLIVGVWEYASPIPTTLYASLVHTVTGKTLHEAGQNPILQDIAFLLWPPQSAFDSSRLSIMMLVSEVEDPYVTRSDLGRGLLLALGALAAFASIWFVIGWLVFPRTARINS